MNFIIEIAVIYVRYVVQSPVCVVTGSESPYLRELYKSHYVCVCVCVSVQTMD